MERLSSEKGIPEHDYIFSLADRTSSLLEGECAFYRQRAKNGKAGGLLDFSQAEALPLVVVPDLHGRGYFVKNIANFVLPETFLPYKKKRLTVVEALEKKLARLVCVGDLLHSELRGRTRWMQAEKEFDEGIVDGPCMTEEMGEGLNLLAQIMELKCTFPENFHVLKGNHENIFNEGGMGNFSFRKFSNEGEMCREFMEKVYGEEVTYLVSCFEKFLPLLAAFNNCVVSHAEPLRPYTRSELVDGLVDGDVIRGLTWTENGAAMNGSVEAILSVFVGRDFLKSAFYFGGHRPIRGLYSLRQNGRFVQLHNPESQNVALVPADRNFNPDEDIVSVG